MILNCTNYDTALESLAKVFNVSKSAIISVLEDVNPYDHLSQSPEDVLYDHMCNEIGEPSRSLKVIWFHGTRIEDENLYSKHGILTKTEARKFIEPRLRKMADGLERRGSNPFSMSLSGKDGPHDEGPFAFLIREVAIKAPSPCHNYLDAPEIVEDLAGIFLGQNYQQLVDRFKSVAKPCVVSFVADSKGYELPYVILYVKLVLDGEAELDAGSAANTFFDAEGVVVPPERIHNIELI
ncbi:hypothetical protein MRB56_08715 [Halomonas cupida]|uniref:hypothetical protein n=1 Tax=Halomonas cupida TaxID=44933 RepID=UPI0039B40C04